MADLATFRQSRWFWPVSITTGVLVAVGISVLVYHLIAFQETDNAYVTGDIHLISPRVTGTVREVRVQDNQIVTENQVLVQLDPSEYDLKLKEALAQEKKARLDLNRLLSLPDNRAITQQEMDRVQAEFDIAQATRENAALQLSYTSVVSPAAGRIGKKTVEEGNRIQPGQTMLTVVAETKWVVANFKETQLSSMKVGNPATIRIDAIPGKKFEGTVESFSPATGSQFALLPSDNATGNFTKIVQRLPVKIVFNPKSIEGYEDRIVPGLSAVITVKVW